MTRHHRFLGIFFLAIISSAWGDRVQALDAKQWRQDLAFLVEQVEEHHPAPWDRTDRAAFLAAADEIRRQLPTLDDRQATVALMRLVARLEDGHSKLVPDGALGFGTWFPVRFHPFTDGVYLTAVSAKHAALGGARVRSIAGRPTAEVMDAVTGLFGADNRFGRREFSLLAASADLLAGLGLLPFGEPLELGLVLRDGTEQVVRLSAVEQEEPSLEWRFWGEIFGPVDEVSATGFEGVASMSLYGTEDDNDMPLHLEARIPYRYAHVPEASLLYFQIRFMTASSKRAEKSLLETWRQALRLAEADPASAHRLVLDLRFNIGGNGALVPPLVTELIRRYPFVDQPGHVFVLTSGATFSAGVMLVEELADHMPLVLVGEPMGAAYNHFGDASPTRLPHSGYALSLSRRWWQLSTSDDARRFVPVQVPAAFSGTDYFGRRDPALALIAASEVPFPSLDRILLDRGGAAARRAFDEAHRRWGHLDHWLPVARETFDDLADTLVEDGRLDDARTALALNTEIFPDDWDTWDDLGQVCIQMKRPDCVQRAYSRALALEPANPQAATQRSTLERLRALP